ncbi:hypothetical protein [Flavobacterium lindanitolerans]|uniref:hypothetical protein n=1 Tax=Flavobacterium lindanitolerans TaxID=428988 RepID=UPI0027B9E424|nr:hypothetical protein [Flavobacterium lindanitolerans]
MIRIKQVISILAILCGYSCFAQHIPVIEVPRAATIPNEPLQSTGTTLQRNMPSKPASIGFDDAQIRRNNQALIQEVERDINRSATEQQGFKETQADIAALQSRINYSLPSWASRPGAEYYYTAYDRIIASDSLFSMKDNVFTIENAYFGNGLDKAEFDKIIDNCHSFLLAAMKERGYDLDSNTAKNFILFQFFSETLQLKNSKQKHLPFKYDFEDYKGVQDYSKMFVTKLLRKSSGQCHSMPLLYLILAEAINAEAYLALSPNHSYIRFPADNGKWYNIELTNGMFSTDSYILQSGYIKSEALQNNIYMQNLSRKELLSALLTDLAQGYIHKYGYDGFVDKVIGQALELYPNSISANMVKANHDTAQFEYVMKQIGINPRDNKQLQNIRYYPKAVELLNKVNGQYAVIDNLGYEVMPDEAYQKWLQSMNAEKQKQENEAMKQQFKGILEKPKSKIKG